MDYLKNMGSRAVAAARALNVISDEEKNRALLCAADKLCEKCADIISANANDVIRAEKSGMSVALIDRLRLDEKRVFSMAEGLRQIAALPTPLGETVTESIRPNGLHITEKRVPIGVIGIIYESRPNVTADAIHKLFL